MTAAIWVVVAAAVVWSGPRTAAAQTPSAAQSATPEGEPHSQSWWSVGGEMRQQYERFANEEWGAAPRDDSGYLLQRYLLRAEAALGHRVRAAGEIKSGIELGRNGGPRLPDEDRADVHQAYLEVGVGRTQWRAGRQELQFGSSRLVSIRDLNVRQSFDAGRLTVAREPWRVDAFAGWPAQTRVGAWDDAPDRDRMLWGVYGVRLLGAPRTSGVDVYYFGYRRKEARFDSGVGDERRHSLGTRLWGVAGAFDYNVEIVGQAGTFGSARIRAWTVASDIGWHPASFPQSRLGLRADVTSGDSNPDDDRLGTFNALFPRGAYFGLIASTGPANHFDLHPQFETTIDRRLTLMADWLFLWRTETSDGLYSVSGRLLRASAGTSAHFVGHAPGLKLQWQAHRSVFVRFDVSTFTAGPFIHESGPGRRITFVSASTSFRF
jgi:Alginate export